MKEISWPYFDPEFENLTEKMFGPRVWIDNESCDRCTVVKVDSLNKPAFHLEVVQVLTDMDLYISKCYISSDGRWSIDVFHVRDQLGCKVTDERVINYLQQAIGARRDLQKTGDVDASCPLGTKLAGDCKEIEMIGTNRPGLFCDISAVLADLKCNIVEAHAWSHNACLACVAYISDESNSSCINDPHRLAAIEYHLSNVLRPNGSSSSSEHKVVRMAFSDCGSSMTSDAEHRLHQLMLANRDFDGPEGRHVAPPPATTAAADCDEQKGRPMVSVDSCHERGYSVVNVDCTDRPKLMFDVVCALTDMQYVVFHACVTCHGSFAHQEYYIRDTKGRTIDAQSEKEELAKCLEAAIKRRVCEGTVRLELCAHSSAGLLPHVTRVLCEYGLTVVRADIETQGERTVHVFYVRDVSGSEVDMSTLERMRGELQPLAVQVKHESPRRPNSPKKKTHVSFGSKLMTQIEKLSHGLISIS
ncbi:hypothetical protein Taro_014215 [Colocasia esculenta]|uniref:ACT domain-containing protein ACR n=1 Tax=Colocasia esculenta TaxID=4460 RepID=A0A843UE97_COLES|nr:hypothetical protein [Colocasia esculenta]